MYLDPQMLVGDESSGVIDRIPGIAFVPEAARVAGGTGDALIEVNEKEHRRRGASGLGAVTALGLLDRLMGLPLDEWVRWDDLHPDVAGRLRTAPAGTVDRSPTGVRRVLVPAATVPIVLVRSSSWRRGLRTASSFEAFAQRVLILERPRRDLAHLAWEADVLGVGVWLRTATGFEEVVAPAAWRQRHVKAAGWRFWERAYRGWLNATHPVR